jgi:hypothetical protein
MKLIVQFFSVIILGISQIYSQNIAIPDTAFLNALIEAEVDRDNDGLISYLEAQVRTRLDISRPILGCGTQAGYCEVPVSSGNICSLEGIEHFTNLDWLNCSGNHIDNIDLSENINLKFLNCRANGAHWGGGLRELNIQKCESLTFLDCSWTQMNFLDISQNTALQNLVIEGYYNGFWGTPGEITLNVWDTFSKDSIGIDSVLEVTPPDPLWQRDFCSKITYAFARIPDIKIEGEISSLFTIRLSCSESGMIYLVPEGTRATSIEIRKASIDSINVIQDEDTVMPLDPIGFGTYWLYAVSEDHLVSSSKEVSYHGVGINNKTMPHLGLFPNPTRDILTIETEHPAHYSIVITSLNGQQILYGEMEGTSHQIDLSSFQKGAYFITVRSKDFVTTRKIIKL